MAQEAAAAVDCEKCQGPMDVRKRPRHGQFVRLIGVLCLVGAALLLAFAAVTTISGILSTGTAAGDIDSKCENEAQQILDRERGTAANLTDARRRIEEGRGVAADRQAVERYESCVSARQTGTGLAVVLGLGFTAVLVTLGLAGIVVGWIMARSERVRVCHRCGFFFRIA
jgi:hypothetical protein